MCKFDSMMLVGTYTRDLISKGFYVYLLDSETMQLKLNYTEDQVADPSSFKYLPERKLLIVANEDPNAPFFSTYHVDLERGELVFIDKADIPGAGTCDVEISPDGELVIGANYDSGNLVWTKMDSEGRFVGTVKTIWYQDTSVNPERQKQSYIHGMTFVGNKLHVMNLGGDCIYRYEVDLAAGELIPDHSQPVIRVKKGEGPRKMLVHPNGKWVYLLTEMGNHLIQYEIQKDGQLKELNQVCMLPEKCEIDCRASVMQLSPDGKCMFAAVRDYDALVKFELDPETGALSNKQFYPSHGEHPRMFAFSPNGRFILVCNQFSNRLAICKFNPDTNEIGAVVESLQIPDCSYVQIISRE